MIGSRLFFAPGLLRTKDGEMICSSPFVPEQETSTDAGQIALKFAVYIHGLQSMILLVLVLRCHQHIFQMYKKY